MMRGYCFSQNAFGGAEVFGRREDGLGASYRDWLTPSDNMHVLKYMYGERPGSVLRGRT